MKKILPKLILCMGLTLLLTGCAFKTADELYALPELPDTYRQLQTKLDEVKVSLGAEYAAPLSGSNTATVQLQDLDGDGVSESTVAFFRVDSSEEPLRILIFRQKSDGAYELRYEISGDGTAIDSINYVDLDGDGDKEIVVSWQISSRVHTLTAYNLGVNDPIVLTHLSYNEAFKIYDLDRDGQLELMVLQMDDTGENVDRVEYYDMDGGQMVLAASAPMSQDIGSITSGGVTVSSLRDNVPALYVTAVSGEVTLTDVYAVRDGVFTNITLQTETGKSSETMRIYDGVPAQDINDDGVLELPRAIQIPESSALYNASGHWLIYWRQFDLEGNAYTVQINYHDLSGGWYLNIPESWVGQITVSRDDTKSIWGERTVIFSRWEGGEDSEPQPFLRIYRLSGSNRATRARLGTRFILLEENSVIYAAELLDIEWNSGLSSDNLIEYFSLIRTEWSNQ